ncbi:hypothetical protein CXG81DRAFT_18355 [Caulochytrium protostelioides]|uniref:Uncharacterized protein n=1 Tax=Caulochytrium protostelioides TaxID=1555241 RepID=A0A4P9X9B2_9FUNG|nr:hypothetical protein CXG81DRAFT_18355 [Caulochytrium protostelioides]|eukprot:RKP01924.1 hypothetical protein CXG81DRAFT_18355 [Caulochytrium protostelioides]
MSHLPLPTGPLPVALGAPSPFQTEYSRQYQWRLPYVPYAPGQVSSDVIHGRTPIGAPVGAPVPVPVTASHAASPSLSAPAPTSVPALATDAARMSHFSTTAPTATVAPSAPMMSTTAAALAPAAAAAAAAAPAPVVTTTAAPAPSPPSPPAPARVGIVPYGAGTLNDANPAVHARTFNTLAPPSEQHTYVADRAVRMKQYEAERLAKKSQIAALLEVPEATSLLRRYLTARQAAERSMHRFQSEYSKEFRNWTGRPLSTPARPPGTVPWLATVPPAGAVAPSPNPWNTPPPNPLVPSDAPAIATAPPPAPSVVSGTLAREPLAPAAATGSHASGTVPAPVQPAQIVVSSSPEAAPAAPATTIARRSSDPSDAPTAVPAPAPAPVPPSAAVTCSLAAGGYPTPPETVGETYSLAQLAAIPPAGITDAVQNHHFEKRHVPTPPFAVAAAATAASSAAAERAAWAEAARLDAARGSASSRRWADPRPARTLMQDPAAIDAMRPAGVRTIRESGEQVGALMTSWGHGVDTDDADDRDGPLTVPPQRYRRAPLEPSRTDGAGAASTYGRPDQTGSSLAGAGESLVRFQMDPSHTYQLAQDLLQRARSRAATTTLEVRR